jgi:hypothetical protein
VTAYEQVLELARQQSAAVARGDVDTAISLLGPRAVILADAPAAADADADTIREILRRDRDLSGAIRERMIDLRDRAVRSQHGRIALAGYQSRTLSSQQLLDATR